MSMSNFSAKENTNVESKSENESEIQDEPQRCTNFTNFLFNIRKKHYNKIIMVHISINSLRNKFDMLINSVTEYIDIQMISETKLDNTFPYALYHLKDFSNPYRFDRSSVKWGHLGHFDLEPNFPTNLMGSSGPP